MTDRIVVLASNSFSGAWFVRYCLERGAEVLGVSRSSEANPIFLPYAELPDAERGRFRFLQGDLNHDLDAIVEAIRDFEPHYVVDYAGQGMVAPSWEQPHQWYQTNLVAKVQLHDALRKLDSLVKYVRFSTPEVYGSTDGEIDESAPLRPSTPYAVSHAAVDMSLRTYHERWDFPVAMTRASNVYGPHQQLYRIVPRSMIYARLGRRLRLDGGGKSVRNFVYIEDACEAVWRVMKRAPAGSIYHVASTEYVSIRELVESICVSAGVPFETLVEIGPDRPGKDQAYFLSTDRIARELDWRGETRLEVGLARAFAWVDQHLDEIQGLSLEYVHQP